MDSKMIYKIERRLVFIPYGSPETLFTKYCHDLSDMSKAQ